MGDMDYSSDDADYSDGSDSEVSDFAVDNDISTETIDDVDIDITNDAAINDGANDNVDDIASFGNLSFETNAEVMDDIPDDVHIDNSPDELLESLDEVPEDLDSISNAEAMDSELLDEIPLGEVTTDVREETLLDISAETDSFSDYENENMLDDILVQENNNVEVEDHEDIIQSTSDYFAEVNATGVDVDKPDLHETSDTRNDIESSRLVDQDVKDIEGTQETGEETSNIELNDNECVIEDVQLQESDIDEVETFDAITQVDSDSATEDSDGSYDEIVHDNRVNVDMDDETLSSEISNTDILESNGESIEQDKEADIVDIEFDMEGDAEEGFDRIAFNELTEYMSNHDYQRSDFEEYSKDPEWRDLISRAFPDYELPQFNDQEIATDEEMPVISTTDDAFDIPTYRDETTAFEALTEYMHENNYEMNDFEEYSKDPEWQALVKDAFPDYKIPEDVDDIDDNAMNSGLKAIENTTEALRDDLEDKGFRSNGIEAITSIEREKLQQELSDNLKGDFDNPYEKPDFEHIINEIKNGRDNYDFSDTMVDYEDNEYLDATGAFYQDDWDKLSLEEREEGIRQLADYVSPLLDLNDKPDIRFYNREEKGNYGFFSERDNCVYVNEYMLDDGPEAADTVAHELWHAHQYDRGERLNDLDDAEYVAAFELYERADVNAENYRNQMVEAEARAFADTIRKGIRRHG